MMKWHPVRYCKYCLWLYAIAKSSFRVISYFHLAGKSVQDAKAIGLSITSRIWGSTAPSPESEVSVLSMKVSDSLGSAKDWFLYEPFLVSQKPVGMLVST